MFSYSHWYHCVLSSGELKECITLCYVIYKKTLPVYACKFIGDMPIFLKLCLARGSWKRGALEAMTAYFDYALVRPW